MSSGSSLKFHLPLFLLTLTLAIQAQAFSFLISKTQIDAALDLTFPYTTIIGGNKFTLSQPTPIFYAPSQEIGITLNIAVKDSANKKDSVAKATLRGGIKFDNKQQQLQLVKPKLEKLNWQGSKQAAIPQLEQLIGQDLPIIVLLDIKQITGGAFTPTLSDIKVRETGIEVLF